MSHARAVDHVEEADDSGVDALWEGLDNSVSGDEWDDHASSSCSQSVPAARTD